MGVPRSRHISYPTSVTRWPKLRPYAVLPIGIGSRLLLPCPIQAQCVKMTALSLRPLRLRSTILLQKVGPTIHPRWGLARSQCIGIHSHTTGIHWKVPNRAPTFSTFTMHQRTIACRAEADCFVEVTQ